MLLPLVRPHSHVVREPALNAILWVQQHYRHWIIWRCPTVRFLDYQKVKDAEREKAAELFGTSKEPSALASKVRRVFLHYFCPN